MVKVFVSYTATDLGPHAEATLEAIRAKEWVGVHFKDWAAAGGHKVETCLEHVRECQVLIVLVAHRYGWVPGPHEGGDGERSMVWLEVAEAQAHGVLIKPFRVSARFPWDPSLIEGLHDQRAHERLQKFIAHLDKRWVGEFQDPRSLKLGVTQVLAETEKQLFDPLRRYQDAVREACGRVALVGFGHDVDVALRIEEVYVPLRVSSREGTMLEARQREEWTTTDDLGDGGDRSIPLEDIAPEMQRRRLHAAALLGDPGCGKSTALRRLAWAASRSEGGAASIGLPADAVPVLLRLRTLRAPGLPGDWWNFVRNELEGWLELDLSSWEWLERKPILWLLDGLDEIADEGFRGKVLDWVSESLRSRLHDGGDGLIVSSRDGGWPVNDGKGLRSDAGFLPLQVDLLTPDQRTDFVHRWYAHVTKTLDGEGEAARAEGHRQAVALCRLLAENDFRSLRLAQIVANPLLLSILCLVHLDQTDLPRRRAALYDRCLAVLLTHWRKEWRRSQDRQPMDDVGAREVLKGLAWWLQSERQSSSAPDDEWERRAGDLLLSLAEAARPGQDGRSVVRRFQDEAGLLVTVSAGQKSFLHTTFLEYLAARYAVDEGFGAELARRFGDERWQEVVLLALSGAPSAFAGSFFTALFEDDRWRSNPALALAMEESLHVPIEPFVRAIEGTKGDGRRELLQLVRRRAGEPLLSLASRLYLEDEDPTVQGLVQEILRSAGRPLPAPADRRRHEGKVWPGVVTQDVSVERAGPKAGDLRIVPTSGLALLYIPSGEFDMGSENGDHYELPVHRVCIRALWLAKHPVTNSEFARYLTATGAPEPEHWRDKRYNLPDQPVVGVSWQEARDYCAWAGLRLPSEAEWEYACRGSTKPTSTEYWFGDDPADLEHAGWFAPSSGGQLHSVAQKRPNPFGLFDVHGNVWEWCEDMWHEHYEGAPKDGTAWVGRASEHRVIRGGGFRNTARFARSAYRYWYTASLRWPDAGFRPAMAITP